MKVKVCGLTCASDVIACHELGVHYTGFIFVPSSPRAVNAQAVAVFPRGAAKRVGVFANASPSTVLQIIQTARLDYVQLHGNETPEECLAIGKERVIKTLWPMKQPQKELIALIQMYAPVCSMLLFDAGTHGGGSGNTLQWDTLANLTPPLPWLLAGGIGPQNVAAAALACSPFGIDCNSGVEQSAGIKSKEAIAKVMNTCALLPNTYTCQYL